ncbi:MAG TPA: hypothetical protein VE986_03390 [Hyphomicrobiales bacterium]|nr:hypothetical protein [Hyphomicrobiales bacterium]
MSFSHLLRVLLAIALSGALGWLCLVAFNVVKVMQHLEAFQANLPDGDLGMLPAVIDDAIRNVECGSAVFLAAGIAGVLLGEIFGTRSLVLYAGATGALTAVLAAGLWRQANAAGSSQAAAALAAGGFVAGAVYWMIACPPHALKR